MKRFPILTAGLGVLLGSTLFAAAPQLSLSTTGGPPTTQIKATVAGFAASEAVDVYFDTTDLALGVTNASGAFTNLTLTVPKSAAPGPHWLTAVGRRAGDASQISFQVATPWNQLGFGARRNGFNSYENVIDSSNVASLENTGFATTTIAVGANTVTANGLTYACAYNNNQINSYVAFDATGAKVWSTQVSGVSACSTPTLANGVLYGLTFENITANDKLYAFNAATGAVLWSRVTSGAPYTHSPAVVNGIVYVGTGVNSASGTLDAFDAVTGVKKWSFQAGGSVNSNPAVVGGVVYFATYSGTVFAVNAVTGVQVWTASGPTADQYNVAVSNGAVYISGNGAITAFSVGSGLTLWSFPTSGGFGSPAVFNSRVFVGESDSSGYSYITALDAGSGNLVWRENLDGFCGYVSGANGVLYVPTYNGTIHAFNPADGTPLWTGFTGSHPSFGYPAAMVADGTVSVPGDNGIKIFGLNAAAARTHGPVAPPQIKTLKPDYSLSVR